MIGADRPVWLGAAAAVLLAAALLSIWLGPRHSRKVKVIWTVIAVVIPIVGPLGWFALGWERKR
jgi:Phospholipase_D-nuclease N-terminal